MTFRAVACVAGLTLLINSFTMAEDAKKQSSPDLVARIEALEAELKETKAKLAALQKRLDQLEKKKDAEPAEEKENPGDLFQVGSTWQGSRFYQQKGADPKKAQDWKLVIKERDKTTFKGEIYFRAIDDNEQVVGVSGTAPVGSKGPVKFKTDRKGVLQQEFAGTLAGGKISLNFSGVGLTGGKVVGTGNLGQ